MKNEIHTLHNYVAGQNEMLVKMILTWFDSHFVCLLTLIIHDQLVIRVGRQGNSILT